MKCTVKCSHTTFLPKFHSPIQITHGEKQKLCLVLPSTDREMFVIYSPSCTSFLVCKPKSALCLTWLTCADTVQAGRHSDNENNYFECSQICVNILNCTQERKTEKFSLGKANVKFFLELMLSHYLAA